MTAKLFTIGDNVSQGLMSGAAANNQHPNWHVFVDKTDSLRQEPITLMSEIYEHDKPVNF